MVVLIKEIPHVYTCITEADRLRYLPKLIGPSWLKFGTELRYPDTILLPFSKSHLLFQKKKTSTVSIPITHLSFQRLK